MSIEQNKAIVRRIVEEAQSGHNLGVVDELLAADFVDHSVPPGLPPTREGVKMQFTMFFSAFPWNVVDQLGLMYQLGAIPQPEQINA